MQNADWLILGLGNPGVKYKNTRHNIGWSVIDKIIEKNDFQIFEETKYYQIAEYKHKNQICIIGMPLTYMNLSGEAVLRLMINYKVPIARIVVLVDEYNFPLGKLHLRSGGSDGGHNGISSIIEKTQNPNFIRLRLGIDRKFGAGELVDYVLSDFNSDELDQVQTMQENAIMGINHLILNGFARSASAINSGKLFKPKAEMKIHSEDTKSADKLNIIGD